MNWLMPHTADHVADKASPVDMAAAAAAAGAVDHTVVPVPVVGNTLDS